MTDQIICHRPLESDLFGLRVYAAEVSSIERAEAVLDSFATEPPGLLVLRVPAFELDVAQRLEAAGARLCDVLLTLSQQFGQDAGAARAAPAGLVVRPSNESDIGGIELLAARAFSDFQGHWHSDRRLPSGIADLLYKRWAVDLARRQTSDTPLFVATTGAGDLIGFLALAAHRDARWTVPLTAVDAAFRGRGALRAMLGYGILQASARGPIQFEYETQLTNVAALRSVSRFGLIPANSRLTFHLWTHHS